MYGGVTDLSASGGRLHVAVLLGEREGGGVGRVEMFVSGGCGGVEVRECGGGGCGGR
jgi:hypothetical protein